MTLHNPNNIKIHFAGIESAAYLCALKELGVNYALYSAYSFIYKMLFSKNKSISESDKSLLNEMNDSFRHCIQDSGLFSLLFGSRRDLGTKTNVYRWYDALVELTHNYAGNATCVEVDAQSIIGVEECWRMRERMIRDLPNNRIINVFHLQDGQEGLDRLIEFSDYIAIGAPELRANDKFRYIPSLIEYIKNKKENIDIHLLGCTDIAMLSKCKHCTSSDSTTWFRSLRFGDIGQYRVEDLDDNKIADFIGIDKWDRIKSMNRDSTATLCTSIEMYKRKYQLCAGNQDYKC